MHERALRRLLLIKAIEESDRAGTLIPPADRVAATRAARREVDASSDGVPPSSAFDARAVRLLTARAETLTHRVVTRYPFVETLLTQRGLAWAGRMLLLASLVIGLSLSALDGSRRIDILAMPLLGLLAWNLLVYMLVAVDALRPRAGRPARHTWAQLLTTASLSRVKRLIVRSGAFNAVLAEALRRFIGEWSAAMRPLLVARAARLLHLCAAAAGVGLVAGLYLRGIVLDYRAGWESTFLDAAQVRAILAFLYAPAAAVTGIALPDTAHIAAIRMTAGLGGEGAARWIHLLAATTMLFIVLPRLALATILTANIWRRTLRAPPPASLQPYFRSVFGALDGERGLIAVLPYAYEPFGGATAALRRLLSGAFGDSLVITLHAGARYGEEETFLRQLAGRGETAEIIVLLFNLAATPEDENHGVFMTGVRDWLQRGQPHTQLLALVDERPFVARMAGAAEERIAQRKTLWREFIAARGLSACFVDLGDEAPERALEDAQRMRTSTWQPAKS